jgi:hypothetical protein
MRAIRIALATATLAFIGVMTGCSGLQLAGSNTAPTQIALTGIHGNVHGGQNPISGSRIQVYQAGTTVTYGTGAVALIPSGSYYLGGKSGCVSGPSQVCYNYVVSDANGNFNVTGDYSCTSGTELYFTATGGNPGSGTNNAALEIAAIGLCDNLANVTFVQINEVTTVGTVYALAQFMSDTYNASTQAGSINIGAPATNVAGLKAAFADVNTLVNYYDGYTPGPAPGSGAVVPAGTTVPVQEIFALADSIAACVNTTGGSGGVCTTLFTDTTENGFTPTDVTGATLNMALYPAVNASAILALRTGMTPWVTTFNTANDLTLAITYSEVSTSAPAALAIDASGNVWVANSGTNNVSELSHTGVAAANSPFTVGTTPDALAVDSTGNIWVANYGSSSVMKLSSSGSILSTFPSAGTEPTGIAVDAVGNIWASDYGTSQLSEYTSSGPAAGSPFTVSGVASPVALAINPH